MARVEATKGLANPKIIVIHMEHVMENLLTDAGLRTGQSFSELPLSTEAFYPWSD